MVHTKQWIFIAQSMSLFSSIAISINTDITERVQFTDACGAFIVLEIGKTHNLIWKILSIF